MNKWVLWAAVALLATLAFWLWRDGEATAPAAAASHSRIDDPAMVSPRTRASTATVPTTPWSKVATPATTADVALPAATTMAHAREFGDERAPAIDATDPEESLHQPAAWDVSDPTRYRDYELRQQERVAAEYLRAADGELPKWRAALAEARMRGASAEDIAAAEEKILRLEATQSALRNGTVLDTH